MASITLNDNSRIFWGDSVLLEKDPNNPSLTHVTFTLEPQSVGSVPEVQTFLQQHDLEGVDDLLGFTLTFQDAKFTLIDDLSSGAGAANAITVTVH